MRNTVACGACSNRATRFFIYGDKMEVISIIAISILIILIALPVFFAYYLFYRVVIDLLGIKSMWR